VGRLSREKDHQTLLQAVSDLVVGKIDAHLLLVGDGPERPAIEASIRQLRLAGRVTLTGQVPSAEPYYGAADICVLSSLSEGSPNALLEGMAARVPVVATAVGGIPEIATDQVNALLVPPSDRARMAEALAALATDEGLAARLAAAAYERILSDFTPEIRVRRLREIYLSLLQGADSVPR
jgi:glycosyltransferase involved in cell wall biosynthesis